jgi:hypothetical protein
MEIFEYKVYFTYEGITPLVLKRSQARAMRPITTRDTIKNTA